MSLLLYLATLLLGIFLGYCWALFEVWVDGREQGARYDELRERVERIGKRKT